MKQEYAFSERRACGLVMVAVSTYRYETRRPDEPLRTRLVQLAREEPRFGYRRPRVLLRRFGKRINHKRLHRVYREARLMIRRKSPNIVRGWDNRCLTGRRRTRSGHWISHTMQSRVAERSGC